MSIQSEQSLSPNTTIQQDMTLEGQREINRIWEHNQARIAYLVVVGGMFSNLTVIAVILFMVILTQEITTNELALILGCLGNIGGYMGVIIGFYFGRTNHEKIGGVGPKATDNQPSAGR